MSFSHFLVFLICRVCHIYFFSSPSLQPGNVDVAEPMPSSRTSQPEVAVGRGQQQATTTLLEPSSSSAPVPDVDADGNAQSSVIAVPEASKSPALQPEGVVVAEPSPLTTASVPEVATGREQQQAIITLPKPSFRSPESSVQAATMRNLIPTPKVARVSRGKREVSHARMLTDSPYKRKLEIAAEEKQRKEEAKKCRAAKKTQQGIVKPTAKEKQMKQNARTKTAKRNRPRKRNKKSFNAETEDDANCLYCNETYSVSSETWFQCQGPCSKWSHMSCRVLG